MSQAISVIGTLAGVVIGAFLGYRLERQRRKSDARESAIIDAAAVLSAYRDTYAREATHHRRGPAPVDDRELHAIQLRVQVHCDEFLGGLYQNALRAATMFHDATVDRATVDATASTAEHTAAHQQVLDALDVYSHNVDRFWAHAQQRLEP